MGTEQTQYRKPVRLAHTALRYALAKDWRRSGHQVRRLNEECGADGLGDALVAWCDALCEHMAGGPPEFDERVRLLPWAVETGETGKVPRESVRWAGELIEARAHGNRDRFVAVMGELNAIADGFERGRWVGEPIQIVALTMANTPRGYAVMGRG